MRVVMGTRPTPPAATASSDQSSRVLDIKKESPDDEIKVRRSFFFDRPTLDSATVLFGMRKLYRFHNVQW